MVHPLISRQSAALLSSIAHGPAARTVIPALATAAARAARTRTQSRLPTLPASRSASQLPVIQTTQSRGLDPWKRAGLLPRLPPSALPTKTTTTSTAPTTTSPSRSLFSTSSAYQSLRSRIPSTSNLFKTSHATPPSPSHERRPLPALPKPIPQTYQQQQHGSQRRTYRSYYDPDGRKIRSAKPLFTRDSLHRGARSPITKFIAIFFVSGSVYFYFSNLETVPVSGRTRFNCSNRAEVLELAQMQYRQILYDLHQQGARILPDWDPRTVRVRQVMKRLIPFSGTADDEEWEVFVIDAPRTANAFVLPGGKVFVFSGILGVAGNDDGLATVLAHEIAHNVADHIGERLSQSFGYSLLLYPLIALAAMVGPIGVYLMGSFGSMFLETAFGMPMSRKQESEADYIGLMMMAEACYDPKQAINFWQRMEMMERRTEMMNRGMGVESERVPEWMSTHPSNENRIKSIKEWLPQAEDKRAQSDCRTTASFADLFREAMSRGHVIIRY